MNVLPQGMEMDLTRFPGKSAETLASLERPEELDRYTYYVAGCVGEFWTRMVCAHRAAMGQWDVDRMSAIGVRFGKGLQLTNIVKDIARDLYNGRCYVPTQWLDEVGLQPADLLKQETLPRFRPILLRMIRQAVEHLDQGWSYTMALPRLEIRQRLACMWPILLAGETLKRVATASNLLEPSVNVKAPRPVVYRIMLLTTLTGACGYVGTAYWGRLRKQIV
jgi:farnesyl-diphosphate farnesyltransferase